MTATATVATTSTTRSDMGADTVLDGYLKDVYLPGITNTLYFNNEFSRAIQQRADIVDATGRRIIRAFATQWGGGAGPIAEGGDFRRSVASKGKQGHEWIKFDNIYFSLTGPTIKTVERGEGSYVDAVTQHVEDVGKKAKLHFERQCMGEQNGRLAKHSHATVVGTGAFQVTGDAFFDTMYLLKGDEIEWRAPVNGTATLRTDIESATTNNYATIDVVTRGTKKTGSVTRGTITTVETLDASVAQNDWICLTESYTTSSASDCLEMNGIRNLITDDVDHSGDTNNGGGIDESTGANYTNTWNLAVTTYDSLQSYVKYINAALDEENLLETLIEAEVSYGSNPNMLIVSKRALLKYFTGIEGYRVFNTMSALDWTGGYKSLGIQLGNRQLMLSAMNSVPSNHGFMLNTADFAFARATNGYEWLTPGGRILQQKEGSDNKFATAVDYRQLVCFSPKPQVKMYGIEE